MSFKRKAARFIAETLVGNALASAGEQVGEAIGRRIGARIYTPPPAKNDEKDKP